jgi:hypothetical protein
MEMSKIVAGSAMEELGQLHVWRSKFFDKAAKCERELRRISLSPATDKTHFKVMAEKILTANKAKDKILTKLIEELIPLIELRAELAHSDFFGFVVTDTRHAMFQNACFSHTHFEKLTVLSDDQRKKAYDRLASIAGQLAKISV